MRKGVAGRIFNLLTTQSISLISLCNACELHRSMVYNFPSHSGKQILMKQGLWLLKI